MNSEMEKARQKSKNNSRKFWAKDLIATKDINIQNENDLRILNWEGKLMSSTNKRYRNHLKELRKMKRQFSLGIRGIFGKNKQLAFNVCDTSTSRDVTFVESLYSEKEKKESEIRHNMMLIIRLIRDQVNESDFLDSNDKQYLSQFKNAKKEDLMTELERLDKQILSLK